MLIEQLSTATSALRGVVGALDRETLSGGDAALFVERFSTIVKLANAGMAICARRVSETRYYERCGHHDAGSWLGDVCGEPTGAARSLLTTAGRLDELPALDAALRSGELSPDQAAAVARGGAADPSSESNLLERARKGSLRELRGEADKVEAAARSREEDEARHARVRAERHLRTWVDPDGSFKGRFSLTPEDGAIFLSGVATEANHLFDLARRQGLREPREAYLADALVAVVSGQAALVPTRPTVPEAALSASARSGDPVAESALDRERMPLTSANAGAESPQSKRSGRRHARPDATILFYVDLEAFVRGSLSAGEECVVEGGGHVPLSVIQRYLDTARIRLVVKKGWDVRSVYSCNRHVPAVLQTALRARDRTCVVPGCSSTFHLEVDHIVEYSKGGKTTLSNLCLLCRWHHALKSNSGYRIEGGPGNWRWIAPPGAPPPGAPPPGAARPVAPPAGAPLPGADREKQTVAADEGSTSKVEKRPPR